MSREKQQQCLVAVADRVCDDIETAEVTGIKIRNSYLSTLRVEPKENKVCFQLQTVRMKAITVGKRVNPQPQGCCPTPV